MATLVYAVSQPDLPPFKMSDRFRHEIAYFMSLPGEQGAPMVAEGEYWVSEENTRRWLDEGVLSLVSPLDSENRTEVELSEEQEAWLEWMLNHKVERVRLQASAAEKASFS
ncbi:MAG TPA: hypothetical protein VMV10_06150 [Pirellulales bacterium]|nr:hypothetical protein [Pirellulales bacterium]